MNKRSQIYGIPMNIANKALMSFFGRFDAYICREFLFKIINDVFQFVNLTYMDMLCTQKLEDRNHKIYSAHNKALPVKDTTFLISNMQLCMTNENSFPNIYLILVYPIVQKCLVFRSLQLIAIFSDKIQRHWTMSRLEQQNFRFALKTFYSASRSLLGPQFNKVQKYDMKDELFPIFRYSFTYFCLFLLKCCGGFHLQQQKSRMIRKNIVHLVMHTKNQYKNNGANSNWTILIGFPNISINRMIMMALTSTSRRCTAFYSKAHKENLFLFELPAFSKAIRSNIIISYLITKVTTVLLYEGDLKKSNLEILSSSRAEMNPTHAKMRHIEEFLSYFICSYRIAQRDLLGIAILVIFIGAVKMIGIPALMYLLIITASMLQIVINFWIDFRLTVLYQFSFVTALVIGIKHPYFSTIIELTEHQNVISLHFIFTNIVSYCMDIIKKNTNGQLSYAFTPFSIICLINHYAKLPSSETTATAYSLIISTANGTAIFKTITVLLNLFYHCYGPIIISHFSVLLRENDFQRTSLNSDQYLIRNQFSKDSYVRKSIIEFMEIFLAISKEHNTGPIMVHTYECNSPSLAQILSGCSITRFFGRNEVCRICGYFSWIRTLRYCHYYFFFYVTVFSLCYPCSVRTSTFYQSF